MKFHHIAGAVVAGTLAFGVAPAEAAKCVKKAAVATAGSAESAKWFALETMVQSVSWGLWPGFLSTGKVEGYRIRNQRYKCTGTGSVTCRGVATFCRVK
ncbi:MAG: hypothetical protein KDJ36_00600 [Hyphomicrobiaceae bacterium]|nr:hypothetical protein [Hyphomicrobiaceae bacterium]